MEECTVRLTTSEADPSIRVISVKGMLSAAGADRISPDVSGVLDQDPRPTGILFDLADVPFVSSGGIRMFLATYKKAAARGMKVAMVHVQPSVYTVFKVAGLEGGLHIHESEAQALAEISKLEATPQ